MDLIVSADGWASWNGKRYRCVVGPAGVRRDKREGDGATPAGRFPFRRLYFRADRLPQPSTGLPVQPIDRADGWCDDPTSDIYNRCRLPCNAGHEQLWRDVLYDLSWLSAIMTIPPCWVGQRHVPPCRDADYRPTEGCVAVAREDLLKALLTECRRLSYRSSV